MRLATTLLCFAYSGDRQKLTDAIRNFDVLNSALSTILISTF
ncbi:hypothetical protein B6N60_02692 [Richelia sinica FACHB-800]|uniref:Uncharacterized protein n=1 Tax=Richelia sinica FACHB-800 TaxID=1357546 RepID=A0A975T8R3_9NOST|nr:hypothetical protein B6N60_02692 [Richelia sinica FACHB-800]